VLERLAEAEARIEHDAVRGRCPPLRRGHALAEEAGDLARRRRRSAGHPASCAARPACASGTPPALLAATAPWHRARAGVDVVDHVGAGGSTARITSGLTVSIDSGTPQSRSASITGSRRSISCCAGTGGRAGSRGLGADVEDVRTLFESRSRVRDGGSTSMQAVAGEGIVGQVDDAHDQRRVRRSARSGRSENAVSWQRRRAGRSKSGKKGANRSGGTSLAASRVRPGAGAVGRGARRRCRGARSAARWTAWADAAAGRP
jgi:hypothetical protein